MLSLIMLIKHLENTRDICVRFVEHLHPNSEYKHPYKYKTRLFFKSEIVNIDKQKLAARNFVGIVEVFQCHLLNYERRSWKTRKCSYFIADNYHLFCVFQLFWSEFCRQHQEWQNSCRKSNQFIITFYVYNNILH